MVTSRIPRSIVFLPYVHPGFRIAITFRKTEINGIDPIGATAGSDEKIVRLDVTVDKILGVDVFYSAEQTICITKQRNKGEKEWEVGEGDK